MDNEYKILKARIDWMDGWGNSPTFQALMDGDSSNHYDKEYFGWEGRNGLYRSQIGNSISFKAYTAPGDGYGGSTFNVGLKDGTRLDMKGPWSSRPGCVNKYFPDRPLVVGVNTTDNAIRFQQPHFGGFAGDIAADHLIEWFRRNNFECDCVVGQGQYRDRAYQLVRQKVRIGWVTDSSGEKTLEPLKADGTQKRHSPSDVIEEVLP